MRWKSKASQNPHEPFKLVFVWSARECLACGGNFLLERMYIHTQVNEGGGISETCYCKGCGNIPDRLVLAKGDD